MDYEQFNQFCRSLPATTYVQQWGGAHVWKVGGKVFAIGGWTDDKSPAFTFKVTDVDFHLLTNTEGFRPAPYMASRGMLWIQQTDNSPELDEELTFYLKDSHKLVSLGLTKKKQKELGLNQED